MTRYAVIAVGVVLLAAVSRSSARPRALVLSFMAVTEFLSMWISNTATALILQKSPDRVRAYFEHRNIKYAT